MASSGYSAINLFYCLTFVLTSTSLLCILAISTLNFYSLRAFLISLAVNNRQTNYQKEEFLVHRNIDPIWLD